MLQYLKLGLLSLVAKMPLRVPSVEALPSGITLSFKKVIVVSFSAFAVGGLLTVLKLSQESSLRQETKNIIATNKVKAVNFSICFIIILLSLLHLLRMG